MTTLSIDGIVRPFNAPTTQVVVDEPAPISRPFASLAIPAGEATERSESAWLEFLGLVRSDEDTVPAGL